ncbi:MAG: 4-(cytidine 5'-diphospho)-2-C-methyl-D-erythritol kinase [Rubrivivax sp.]|nr:4-(cytidine 5'-diphospho)-2-C-methyl-D-erythritol kinase [Rubrivivax sp.]
MTLRALHDVPAPAKLNLFLHVTGRRDDGYHLLQSLFVLIDWSDRLHFERREDGRIARHDLAVGGASPAAALPADDLCVRAARALAQASGTTLGADIHLAKQVPTGAGMGGGSSDAATTLLALNRLWGLGWPRERLAQIGLMLGADVPFFVQGCNAFVEGVGERITPLRVPARRYAVVKPASSLDTASIFRHPALRRDTEPVILSGFLGGGALQGAPTSCPGNAGAPEGVVWSGGFGTNDLQPPAEDRCPEVAEVARWLQARFGNSRMTGSGSAVFSRVQEGIVPGQSAPPQAMPAPADPPDFLAGLPAGWVGRLCRGLDQHPLRGWAG